MTLALDKNGEKIEISPQLGICNTTEIRIGVLLPSIGAILKASLINLYLLVKKEF